MSTLVGSILLLIVLDWFLFDTYTREEQAENPRFDLYQSIVDQDLGRYYQLLERNGIERSTEHGMNYIENRSKRMGFADLDHILYADSAILIIGHGPNTLVSGWRFFLLPSYTTVEIFEIQNLNVIAKFRFWGYVKWATLVGQTLYLKLKNGALGIR